MTLSLDEARRRILEAVPRLPTEFRSFRDALGHVLAQDVIADTDLPPWPNSGMDGFAVVARDLESASEGAPCRLDVVADLPAGRAPTATLERGQAIRIMTGAPIPDGADAVAIVETTRREGSDTLFLTPVKPGENIRRAGENVARGETVLVKGTPIRAPEVGLLASLGKTVVPVCRKPVVGIISSGDELVPPEQVPGPGQIRDSNRFMLGAHLASLGFSSVDMGNAPDREADLRNLFLAAAGSCDAIVSTGGVSVGDYDLTRKVLESLGKIDFWRIAIRPGKPVAFGFIGNVPVFGLPGNPVSSFVVLDQVVRPALRRMSGHIRLYRDTLPATLEEPIRRTPGRTEFIRAIIRLEGGRYVARSAGAQGSGILKAVSRSNGLIVVPADVGSLEKGAAVECQLFSEDV